MTMSKRVLPWLLLSLSVIAIDQLTKQWALHALDLYQIKPVLPFFNFTLAFNTGAAFSFLSNSGVWHQWFFTLFATTMSIVLVVWLVKLPAGQRLQALSLSFILGGALGNLVDRLLYGHVIDFLDVYYKHYHWPAFNIADSAITVGAILLIIDMLGRK